VKNLENYGVQELNTKEIGEIDEGDWVTVIRVIAYALTIAANFDEWYQQSGYIDNEMGIPVSP